MAHTISDLTNRFMGDDSSFSLVWRDDLDHNSHCKNFEGKLSKHLIEEKRVSKWPGTELDSISATIRYYGLNKQTAALLDCVTSPLQLSSPNYPEDLAFYINGNLVYGSCSHEGYEWEAQYISPGS